MIGAAPGLPPDGHRRGQAARRPVDPHRFSNVVPRAPPSGSLAVFLFFAEASPFSWLRLAFAAVVGEPRRFRRMGLSRDRRVVPWRSRSDAAAPLGDLTFAHK